MIRVNWSVLKGYEVKNIVSHNAIWIKFHAVLLMCLWNTNVPVVMGFLFIRLTERHVTAVMDPA